MRFQKILLLIISLLFAESTLTTAQTTPDRIWSLSWSPDGTTLAVAGTFSSKFGIQLRDESGKITDFIETLGTIRSISWSPDGQYISGVTPDGFKILSANSGNVISEFEQVNAINDPFTYWHPVSGSNRIANQDGVVVYIRNAQTGEIVNTIIPRSNSNPATTLEWNSDGTSIYILSDSSVQIVTAWDANTLEPINRVEIDNAIELELSPDGTQLAVGTRTNTVVILDVANLSISQTLQGIDDVGSQLWAVRWHPDGRHIVASGYDKITEWDLESGSIINTIPYTIPFPDIIPQALDYSPNGELTFVGTDNQVFMQPISDAGNNQIIADIDDNGDESIALNGSESSDSDGIIVSYSWSINDVEIATGINPQITLPVGEHTITLTVTDDDGVTAVDNVKITIR